MEHARPTIRRCAIYTRKSSEEGLEQNFNSLHAQREACEAFIKSQAGEGWRLVKTHYDDGGLSGATMERPALQQLMADIDNRLVDAVVAYKLDRLTRSVADLAKMVEVFESRGVSQDGVESGGQAFSRGALYTLLRNPIYVGEIRHKGVYHRGQHTPIVDRAMWDKVAQLLREHGTASGARNSTACVLMGKLFDD